MSTPIEYASFLIRLWQVPHPEGEPPVAEWHGEVEHIQSDQLWDFHSLDDLLVFLRQQADELGCTGFAEESVGNNSFPGGSG